jgi:hypothetical protein
MVLLASLSRATLSTFKPARGRVLPNLARGSSAKQGRPSRARTNTIICEKFNETFEELMSDVYATIEADGKLRFDRKPVQIPPEVRAALVDRRLFAPYKDRAYNVSSHSSSGKLLLN